MSRTLIPALYWYNRADHARALANRIAHEPARALMLAVADDYQKLGDRAAERERRQCDEEPHP